jgi:hypothetical protein
LPELYACPRCFAAVGPVDDALHCGRCGTDYPSLGGVPCLVEDPPLWRTIWGSRLHDYLEVSRTRLEGLRREAGGPNLLPRTRQRIERVASALELDRTTVAELFADFVQNDPGVPTLLPSPAVHSGDPPLLQYSEHLFRDWVWGDDESERSLSLVTRLANGRRLGKLAVYGAGTGRLAFDIQRTLEPECTLGLDLNPLPLLVGARLLRGEELELHEFPLAPHSEDSVALRRRLRVPLAPPHGLRLAFADALRPPVAPGSLDTVVTPWFIDAVGADLRTTAAAVNRVLRPGGLWLNFGPLRFQGPLATLYLADEVEDIVESCSFTQRAELEEDVPYFRSPSSGTARIDRVFGFAAEKIGETALVEPPHLFAPWLSNPSLPIPLGPAMPALRKQSVFTVGILSMIDGRRSIRELASALGSQWGVPPAPLEEQLRPYLARLPFD